MFRIGEFSKMGRTTVKTLRYYDEIGLMKPETTDPVTGYRFYMTGQLILLHKIQSLRQIGLSIEEINLILMGLNPTPTLEKRRAELLDELALCQDQLSRIEFILQGKEEDCFMNYQAIIKDLPECIVYSKQMVVPNYDAYFELIPAIGEKLKRKYPDLKCMVPPYCFIIYLDGEYKESDIHVEFCEAVDQMRPDFEDIQFKKIRPVTAVAVMHKGPYAGLSEAYAYILKWVEENGYVACEPPRESYIDGIWNKDDEADWLTEIQVPVVKK